MEPTQIIKLIEILAWPLAVLAIASAIRSPVIKLIARINAVEAGGIRAEFGAGMIEVRQINQESKLGKKSDAYDSKGSQLQRLAEHSPNGAVVDAWREVELATISAALHSGLNVRGGTGRVSGNAAAKQLQAQGLISQSAYDLYTKLKDLRNKAVNSAQIIETSDAKEYSLAALELASKFREFSHTPD